MYNEDSGGIGLGGAIIIIVIMTTLAILFYPFIQALSTHQEPIVTRANASFNGTLGMVTYNHGWFGIGTTGTTLSFQNGTDITTFTFDKELPVTMGKNYTITYEIKTVTYYNTTANLWQSNSTTIYPKSIILQTENQEP